MAETAREATTSRCFFRVFKPAILLALLPLWALALNIPAITEQPPLTVDFVWNRGFDLYDGSYEFSFKVQNLFGETYEAYQERGGDRVDVDVYDLGTSVSMGLKRRF